MTSNVRTIYNRFYIGTHLNGPFSTKTTWKLDLIDSEIIEFIYKFENWRFKPGSITFKFSIISTMVYRTDCRKLTIWGILTSKIHISSYRYAKKASNSDFNRENSAQLRTECAVGWVASAGTVFRFEDAAGKNQNCPHFNVELRPLPGSQQKIGCMNRIARIQTYSNL